MISGKEIKIFYQMSHVSSKIVVITLFACLTHSMVSSANSKISQHDPNLVSLMDSLKKVERVEAQFTEKKTISILNEPLHILGVLKYKAPSYLEKHVTHPTNERYMVDGATMTIENISKNKKNTFSLERYPPLWAFIEGIRATLAGDLKTLDHFYKIDFTDGERWSILLTPKQSQMLEAVKEMEIFGLQNRVEQVKITSRSGDTSVMSIIPEAK